MFRWHIPIGARGSQIGLEPSLRDVSDPWGPDGSMNFGPVAAVVPGFGTDSSGVRGFSDGHEARCWELLHASEGMAGWSSRRIRIGLRQRDGTIPHLWHCNNKNYRSLMHPSRRATPIAYRAKADVQARFTALAHHLTAEFLEETWQALNQHGAPGLSGETMAEYARTRATDTGLGGNA